GAEPDADGGLGGGGGGALVEQQVERPPDRRQAGGELGGAQGEEPARGRERLLAARDPLLDGGAAGEEGGRDLVGAEAAQDVEDEGELRLLGQARVAAGEHHAQLLVADGAGGEGL